MTEKALHMSSFRKQDSTPLWKWKTIDLQQRKTSTVPEFFHDSGRKTDDVILGPGVGAGIGCGVGVGLIVAGAAGFDGSAWNSLHAVFGIGLGCGAGIGLGFGQGFGAGFSLEALKSRVSNRKSKSKKRVA